MLNVVELFSGIGSQKQALENVDIDYKVVTTVEWEIAAIIAYHIMHHGGEVNAEILSMSKDELVSKLSELTLSNDGKKPIKYTSLRNMPLDKLQLLMQAVTPNDRTHFTDITQVKGFDLATDIDLMTYSFPCQDLSLGSVFHNGNNNGIKKNGGTRSGLLWEVERILNERIEKDLPLPKFLLMENVMQVFSKQHKANFQEWLDKLSSLGYYNHFSYEDMEDKWVLNASDFGLPQFRKRAFMLSVKTDNNEFLNKEVSNYLRNTNNLTRGKIRETRDIREYIFLDKYLDEQLLVHPNYTRSRKKIHGVLIENTKKFKSRGNPIIVKYNSNTKNVEFTGEIARTITTKQDRNPNAGLIETIWGHDNSKPYRYLTQRECFGLMGFPNYKYDKIKSAKVKGLDGEKMYKLAGNSICVPILEEIFLIVDYLKKEILYE